MSRTPALMAFRPVLRPIQVQALRPCQVQVQSRRAYADKAAPVSGQRDWSSRMPLLVLTGVAAYLPFYYFSHTSKPSASGKAEVNEARRQGDPSNEYRDPRDSPVKTLEQKKQRDGVDLSSSENKK